MKKRIDIYTAVAPVEERLATWESAIESEENHAKLGKTLQAQGLDIIKANTKAKKDNPEAARLIQQATNTIDKGTKIEREALRELIKLRERMPK